MFLGQPMNNDVKENYKIIAIDLSKQQALDADPREIQQIKFRWGRKYKSTSIHKEL